MTSHAFDLSLPDSRMAAALTLSRHLRARVMQEVDASVDWAEVRACGALSPDLFLSCIELFRKGACGELDAVFERGRVMVAYPGAMERVRRILARIPGRADITEIRLDGDWAVCRLRDGLSGGRTSERATHRFLKAQGERFPARIALQGIDYRCSYAFGGGVDIAGIDLLGTAVDDVQSWFDSFGQALLPFYHPRERELQEVLVISPLGMVNEDDPWCWTTLADRLIPFFEADGSPMRDACPALVAEVDELVRRFRGQPWTLPVSVRGFRRMQRKLHWSCEEPFDEIGPLLAIVADAESLMSTFAAEFEPLMAEHAALMLEVMDEYCAEARAQLWARLREGESGDS